MFSNRNHQREGIGRCTQQQSRASTQTPTGGKREIILDDIGFIACLRVFSILNVLVSSRGGGG